MQASYLLSFFTCVSLKNASIYTRVLSNNISVIPELGFSWALVKSTQKAVSNAQFTLYNQTPISFLHQSLDCNQLVIRRLQSNVNRYEWNVDSELLEKSEWVYPSVQTFDLSTPDASILHRKLKDRG